MSHEGSGLREEVIPNILNVATVGTDSTNQKLDVSLFGLVLICLGMIRMVGTVNSLAEAHVMISKSSGPSTLKLESSPD